jgi:hypothetical protein
MAAGSQHCHQTAPFEVVETLVEAAQQGGSAAVLAYVTGRLDH